MTSDDMRAISFSKVLLIRREYGELELHFKANLIS